MIARLTRWLRSRRRELTPDELAAQAEEQRVAEDLETTRTVARSPLRDFTQDSGRER